MGGDSASGNQYVAPEQCPEQYITNSGTDESGRPIYNCPFSGVIHVAVEGRPWSRTWWSPSGDSVVEWLPAAKAAFANSPDAMDERFDRDHAAWVISEQVRLAAEAAAAAAARRTCSLITHAAWSRSNRSSMASGELAKAAFAAGSHSTTESPDGDHQVRDQGCPSTATWITPLKGQL